LFNIIPPGIKKEQHATNQWVFSAFLRGKNSEKNLLELAGRFTIMKMMFEKGFKEKEGLWQRLTGLSIGFPVGIFLDWHP
jgi:hypothetical protein